MAFVSVPARALRVTNFRGRAVSEAPSAAATVAPRRATTRMLVEDGEVAPTKGSQWKENEFTGGIPGGEAFYKQWIEDGMEADFADMPERMQPTQPKLEAQKKSPSFLKRIDSMEFFKDFKGEAGGAGGAGEGKGAGITGAAAAAVGAVKQAVGGSAPVGLKIGGKTISADGSSAVTAPVDGAAKAPVVGAAAAATEQVASLAVAKAQAAAADDPEAPDASLYEQYFPESVRNIAPEITMVCERDFFKDRIGVAMTPVTAKCTDVYFPKETEGKAPIFDIFYDGSSLATASISMTLSDVEPLPATAPIVPAGVPAAQLVKGPGGGLKLEYVVDGEAVSAYSDPRCGEAFDKMCA